MHRAIAKLIPLLLMLVVAVPAMAATSGEVGFASADAVMRWMGTYRAKPDPARMPVAARALAQMGVFKETESSGDYLGFIAGVIGSNPSRAEDLIGKMLGMPTADQWVIVRAIAYSGLPDWKRLMRKFAERLPARKVMIDKYLGGELPTLDEIPLEKHNPTLWDKVRGAFGGKQ